MSISLISKASAALLFFFFSFLLSVFLIFSLENANLASRKILYGLCNSCVKCGPNLFEMK